MASDRAFRFHMHIPCGKREVVDFIPGHDRPKSLKLVVVAYPFSSQDYLISTTTGPPVSG